MKGQAKTRYQREYMRRRRSNNPMLDPVRPSVRPAQLDPVGWREPHPDWQEGPSTVVVRPIVDADILTDEDADRAAREMWLDTP